MKNQLLEIPLERLRRCPIELRTVRKETLAYIQLRDSIREFGQLVPLLVRPRGEFFEAVDGAHRYEVLDDLRSETALCHVREMTDSDVLRFQIVAHATRIETKPIEYAHRLWRIVNIEQTLTIRDIAHSVHQTVDWVKRMMNLVNLSPACRTALERECLSVSAAIELSKLPVDQQDRLLPVGDGLGAGEFRDLIRREARHHRQGVKDTRIASRTTDELDYRFRKFREILHELKQPTVAASVLTRAGASTALDGWKTALSWVLQHDQASLERRKKRSEQQARRAANLDSIPQPRSITDDHRS